MSESILQSSYARTGKELLAEILENGNAGELVRGLPHGDFYWLIQRIGPDDALPVLEMASAEQWEYLLDLELWRKDRLDPVRISSWLRRLLEANPDQLAEWILADGEGLALHYLQGCVEVAVHETEEMYGLPEGYFTLDNVFFVRVTKPRYRKLVERLLRAVASADLAHYQNLLLALASVVPAQSEEELYRRRTARLSEHGFLPFEDAVSVYAPLDIEALRGEGPSTALDPALEPEEIQALVPATPLRLAAAGSPLARAGSQITDPMVMERLRLEFAVLCNQLVAADGLLSLDVETLRGAWEKGAGYVGMALEELCGEDVGAMVRVLARRPLNHLFRAGVGLVTAAAWETQRWFRQSWFRRMGLDAGFWGEVWGGTLSGMLRRRPKRYTGSAGEGGYGEFERLCQLHEAREVLGKIRALDALLERMAGLYPPGPDPSRLQGRTFHVWLFHPWARSVVGLDPGFAPLSPGQAGRFLRLLRVGEGRAPYRMPGWAERFVGAFLDAAPHITGGERERLRKALEAAWREVQEEYEWIPAGDLDPRYMRFLLLEA
jgi:hypothetical protein